MSAQEEKKLRKRIERSLRFRIFRRLFPNRHQTVNVLGHRLLIRPGTPDLKVSIQSLGTEFASVADIVDRDFEGLIIDAGGYIGTAAIKLADMFPRANVVTIEPSSANFAILSSNVRRYGNIKPVHAALVAAPCGPLSLSDRGTGNWGFTIISEAADRPDMTHIEQVPTCTLPEICAQFGFERVGFLKLDIEGAEKSLFDGDPEISGMGLVDTLMVELHDRILPGCSESLHKFAQGRDIRQTTGEKFLLRCK